MDELQKSPLDVTETPPAAVLCVGFAGSERAGMERTLVSIGLRARWADTRRQALCAFSRSPSIVLANLSGTEAFRTARVLGARQRGIVVIGVVDASERNVTAAAARAGVVEIARRPLLGPELAAALNRAHQFRAMRVTRAHLTPVPDSVFVRSPGMRRAVGLALRAGASRSGLVMVGEPGTGRELLARTIHRFDGQECENFIVVDCATARPGGVEAELFGNGLDVVGSQPSGYIALGGASALCRAHGGTLFIKNVGEMSSRGRARLARALDHRHVCAERHRYFELDVRLVISAEPGARNELAWADFGCTTELEQIKLPPLRERREDIPFLANYFLDRIGALPGATRKALSPAAVTLLAALPWRGNAPELQELLADLVLQVPGEVIRIEDIVATVQLDGARRAATQGTLREARARFEQEYVTSIMEQHHGRVRDAARALGIRRTNLYRKLRRMRLQATRESQLLHDRDVKQASMAVMPTFDLLRVAADNTLHEPPIARSSS